MSSSKYYLELLNGIILCVVLVRIIYYPLVILVDQELSLWTNFSRAVNIGPIMNGDNCTDIAAQYFSNLSYVPTIRDFGPITPFWIFVISSTSIVSTFVAVQKRCIGLIFPIGVLIVQIVFFTLICSLTFAIYPDWTCGDQHLYLRNYATIIGVIVVAQSLLMLVTIVTIPCIYKCIQENNRENTWEEGQLTAVHIEEIV